MATHERHTNEPSWKAEADGNYRDTKRNNNGKKTHVHFDCKCLFFVQLDPVKDYVRVTKLERSVIKMKKELAALTGPCAHIIPFLNTLCNFRWSQKVARTDKIYGVHFNLRPGACGITVLLNAPPIAFTYHPTDLPVARTHGAPRCYMVEPPLSFFACIPTLALFSHVRYSWLFKWLS